MEQETRNALQKATQRIRRILEDEFAEQLEGTFDILAGGKILPQAGAHLNARQVLTRQKLVDAIEHIRAGGRTPQEAVQQYTREAAFTFLNRFVALRMLESRGMLQECVSKGDQSAGFREFCGLAPGLAALEDGGYRLYLECLFDELSVEIKVLFDRRDSASLLWPRRGSLTGVLEVLQQRELAGVWSEDETIGWVYQYYNDEAERRQMRAESAAPRNSRELAVRNQFFTPRYVVEFLTDNTLGRIWYEMTRGQTVLRDRCRYLVRRPAEIFLQPGEAAPESTANAEQNTVANLSQEELLRQPVYIPHRALKDPREIRLLDPACGSMHFGLYAFDLFTAIWEEAWEIANGQNEVLKTEDTFAAFVEFASTFADKTAFQREVPRLIIQHNIHGIDIDARAAQIANLSIWLRAQRSWHQLGTKWSDRPRILRSNIVCAEPMPGEKSLLREFIEQQFQEDERPAFAFLLEKIFDRMTLAGEAGSLLRIEEEIRTAIAEAHTLAIKQSAKRQKQLFDDDTPRGMEQREFDLRGLNDEQFWQAAERRIYDALEAYAGQAESSGGFHRRLFADDAGQGFAFIEICRNRYDLVVMNPPFGLFTDMSLAYAKLRYPTASNDFYAAFVIRALELTTASGMVGVISSRAGFFLEGLQDWRENLMCGKAVLRVVADLGYGVLDALVETAAYVVDKHQRDDSFTVLSALSSGDKEATVTAAVNAIMNATAHGDVHVSHHKALRALPGAVVAYWLPDSFVARMLSFEKVSDTDVSVFSGLQTDDDFRFLRLAWEAPINGAYEDWFPFAKGGEYQPFADDLHLVVNWTSNGAEMKHFVASIYENWSRHIKNTDRYFRSGLTYTERTTSDISIRAFPAKAIFSVSGPVVQSEIPSNLYCAWALFTSRVGRALIEMAVGSGDTSKSGTAARHYRTGILKECFWPQLSDDSQATIKRNIETLFRQNSDKLRAAETHRLFAIKNLPVGGSFEANGKAQLIEELNRFLAALSSSWKIDSLISEAFGLSGSEVDELGGSHPSSFAGLIEEDSAAEVQRLLSLGEEELCAESFRRGVHARTATKKNFTYSRQLELIVAITRLSPKNLRDLCVRNQHLTTSRKSGAYDAVSIAMGLAFGRWDIRYATGEQPVPVLPDPFAPLPVCPPGMLQGEDGLPLSPDAGRQLRADGRYPLDIAWDGILVDDPEHPLDVEKRVHDALAVLWGDRVDAIQQEACVLLGVPTLREWFRRPTGFFADHLKRYSKSRRKAPIYWPISTSSSSYTVWLYYHRFSKDTFFKVREIVGEKQGYEQRKLQRLKEQYGAQPTRSQAKEMETQEKTASEIKSMCEEIDRIAPLWNPNLNDGVIINFAPLWRLVPQHKAWQKECKECWDELVAGTYDWAHVAMHLWPERVVPKCVSDASLAIAHGLEDTFWQRDDRDRLQPKPKPAGGWQPLIDELVQQRSSPAVKAALKSLLEAPVAGAGAKKSRGRRGATS